MFQTCSLFSCNTFFWNTLLCLGQSNSCFLRRQRGRVCQLLAPEPVIGVRTGIMVTQSPMQAEDTGQKKLRSM